MGHLQGLQLLSVVMLPRPFDSSVATVTLTSAQLTVDKNLTIDGGTAGVTIARSDEAGTPDFRIFDITGGTVTLDGLTIRNGNVSDTDGGGIASNSDTVAVTSQPTATVAITITPDAQLSTDPLTLTFTTANWTTPQTVTVAAVDDTVEEGQHTGVISHSASSSDNDYNGLPIAGVTVTIQDSDEVGNPTNDPAVYLPLIVR
jgi:hypothetical protein